MENLIIILFSIGLMTLYFLIALTIFTITQLISYRIFNFNLYKFTKNVLFEKGVN